MKFKIGGFMKDITKSYQCNVLIWVLCLIQVIIMIAIFYTASSVFTNLPWGIGPGDQVIPAALGLPVTFIWGISILVVNIKAKVLNVLTVIAQFSIFGSYLTVCYISSFYTYFSVYYFSYAICGSISVSFILIVVDFVRYRIKKKRNLYSF